MTATIALRARTDWLARLRTIMVLRPGHRVVNIPGDAVSVSRRAVSSGTPWWLAGGAPTPVAVYDSVAGSKAASAINRANPGTYDLSEAGTVTWSSGAWSGFSGANCWNTGITPADGYSMIVQFADRATSTWQEIAGSVGTGSTRFRCAGVSVLNTAQRYYGYGSTNQSVGTTVSSGIMALTPTGGYYNGSSDGTITPTWSGTAQPIFVGTHNANGTPSASAWTGSIQRLAIYSSNIAAYVAALSAAMATL